MGEPMSILNQRPEISLLEEVALLKGIAAALVEKDWLVVQLIQSLANLQFTDFALIFSGGTCLSKAHRLLQRFSEDVDFRVQPIAPAPSRKALSSFKKAVMEGLRTQGWPIAEEQVRARDNNRFFAMDMIYPSVFPPAQALRPHLLLEITVRPTNLPPQYLPVSSFVNELAQQPPEVARIGCIDPVESAADKLSALAWRVLDRVRQGDEDDPSLVRHPHDLAILQERALAAPDFASLVAASMTQDEQRAKTVALTGLPVAEKFQRMLGVLATDPEYPSEYARFVQGVSYAPEGSTPDFVRACQAVQTLVEAVR